MIKDLVNNRWFSLADLMLVSVSIVLWELRPQWLWLPLMIALLPWTLRLVAGKFPFRRTSFDLPILLFLMTASVGVWAAYNREIAWAKFWLLVGAVFLFYALAGQSRENFWILSGIFALLGASVAVYFLITHDWGDHPAKATLLTRAGLWWMGIRPTTELGGIHPNDAAGVMAVMSPFLVAIGWRAWRKKAHLLLAVTLAMVLLISVSLLLTTSRGAWLALGLVMGLSVLWSISGRLSLLVSDRREAFFSVVLIVLLGLSLGYVVLFPNNLLMANSTLLDINTAGTRLALIPAMLDLIADFPITGGGLGAFPGLYSQYILNIPHFYLPDGHNIFLDAGLEQGLLGLFSLVFIFAGSFWLLFSALNGKNLSMDHEGLFCWAILAGLMVMSLHGLVEDWVYSDRGIPLLFAFSGIATRFSHTAPLQINMPTQNSARSQMKGSWSVSRLAVMMVVFGILGYVLRAPLRSAWYANWGAVQVARHDLAAFPSAQWDDGERKSELAQAEDLFRRALQTDPRSRTAHHRLGLIAMLRRDFSMSVVHLEAAHRLDPKHRGIRKALGNSYTWAGQPHAAAQLLVEIPEAQHEMKNYVWWWGTQKQAELSSRAEQMATYLETDISQLLGTTDP